MLLSIAFIDIVIPLRYVLQYMMTIRFFRTYAVDHIFKIIWFLLSLTAAI
jgi:hypothetical protein